MECDICFDSFKDPKSLQCGHSFCANCLKPVWKNQAITCPTCRRTTPCLKVEDLPTNWKLKQMAELYNAATSAPPAESRASPHASSSQAPSEKGAPEGKERPICSKHKAVATTFCKQCSLLTCGTEGCIPAHSGHQFTDIGAEYRERLNKVLEALAEAREEADRETEELDRMHQSLNVLRSKVSDAIDQCINDVRATSNRILLPYRASPGNSSVNSPSPSSSSNSASSSQSGSIACFVSARQAISAFVRKLDDKLAETKPLLGTTSSTEFSRDDWILVRGLKDNCAGIRSQFPRDALAEAQRLYLQASNIQPDALPRFLRDVGASLGTLEVDLGAPNPNPPPPSPKTSPQSNFGMGFLDFFKRPNSSANPPSSSPSPAPLELESLEAAFGHLLPKIQQLEPSLAAPFVLAIRKAVELQSSTQSKLEKMAALNEAAATSLDQALVQSVVSNQRAAAHKARLEKQLTDATVAKNAIQYQLSQTQDQFAEYKQTTTKISSGYVRLEGQVQDAVNAQNRIKRELSDAIAERDRLGRHNSELSREIERSRSWKRIFLVSVFLTVLAFILPYVWPYLTKYARQSKAWATIDAWVSAK